ncbi:hypothetical protein DRQ36_01500 [bacterium]|nr:MAG: hypothetical protein DRQ36_01500 [bacterium]
MKIHAVVPLLVLMALIAAIALFSPGCEAGTEGESTFECPDGPKIIFRGGYGNIVIKYQPPPEPIFKVGNATQYLDFNNLQLKYGIIEQPLIISYNVKSSVIGASVESNTLDPAFDNEVLAIIKSWTYTRWGFGRLWVKVEMARSRITVDMSGANLADRVPNQSMPRFGEPKEMVAAYGFNKVVRGEVH